jgi:cation transport regulator ChaB
MEEPSPVGKVRDAEEKRNSRKDLPATLRAALPTMLREVFRVAMQAGAKAPGRREEE